MDKETRMCTWCGKPMGNSWNKSANGNYIHKKCVDNFKSYFKRKKKKVVKWKDYGESSLTLLAVHCGMDKEEPSIPYDPSDFRRCVHLIKCLGLTLQQEKELLQKTIQIYPKWIPFVKNWGKLMGLYIKEREQYSAPKLYEALLNLRKFKEVKPNSSQH